MYFYGLNLGPPGAGPSCTLGLSFELTWYRTTRQCYIPNFMHLSQVVLKKKIFYIFLCSSMFEPRTPWPGAILDPGIFVSKGHPGNVTFQISSTWAKQFLNRRFCEVISFLNPRPPPPPTAGPFWTSGPTFEQTWQRSTWQCYIYVPNIKALGLAVSEEMSFEAIVDDTRQTTHGHWVMAIAHLQPMAQVS